MIETTIHKEIKNAVTRSQHTQRNWDLSKEVPQDDLDLIIHSATNCPSKQNFAFYNLHVITNRDIIEKIHALSTGLGYIDQETGERIECTNPQTLANVLLVFEEATMSEQYKQKFKLRDSSSKKVFERDRDMAIGIAAGYVNVVSSMLGYQTGCCACGEFEKMQELLGLKNKPKLLMGVGYKDPNRQRREHHTDNVKIPRRVKEEINVSYFK